MGWVRFMFILYWISLKWFNYFRASVLIQYIYQDLNFKSPFLVTYLANSLLVFYLPLWQLWILLGVVKPTVKLSSVESESDNEDIRLNSCFESQAFNDNSRIDQSNLSTKDSSASYSVSSHREVIKIAMVISPVWFLANCLYNYSLLMTSNSSSTIIRCVSLFLNTRLLLTSPAAICLLHSRWHSPGTWDWSRSRAASWRA